MRGEINGKINPFNVPNGEINGKINPFNVPNGEINGEIKIFQLISNNPGIKREQLLIQTEIPLRTIDRILKKLKDAGKIEYRGSRKTGGWYVKT